MSEQLTKRQAIEIVARHNRYWENAIAEIDDLPAPTRAQQLKQALAMPEIKALVKALKLAEELYQLGLLAAPSGLADKVASARQSALAAVGVEP